MTSGARVGSAYAQLRQLDERWDAIVIGSGIGGLTCAALLARRGHKRVLVLERHYAIGGYTHTFTRPGFEWDVGVHYVGQTGENGRWRRVFDEVSEGRIGWARLPEVYDRVALGERSYDFVAGEEPFIERMASYFPGQKDALARYVALLHAVDRDVGPYFLSKALGPLGAWLLTPLVRRGLKHMRPTTAEVLGQLTASAELRACLSSQYFDYGLPPSRSSFAVHALVARHYLRGAWYPVGGGGALARGIEPVITSRGGLLLCGAEVREVLVREGRACGVSLADGRELYAPLVVSDAGAANTFGHLLRGGQAPAPAVEPSPSYVCLYVGLNQSDAALGLTGTNHWLMAGPDHDANFAAALAEPQAPFPAVFVSFPSAKDPTWPQRFPGRATCELAAPASFDTYSRWAGTRWMKRGPEYEALKAQLSARLLELLYQRWPQTRGQVGHAELSTPLSTRHFSAHPRGEMYGLAHSPQRLLARIGARSPVRGLYLTGSDLGLCGVCGAASGGVITAAAILGASLLPRLLPPRPFAPLD